MIFVLLSVNARVSNMLHLSRQGTVVCRLICNMNHTIASSESLLQRWTGAGTSQVDWCQKNNYTVTPHIAEFVNTVSNAIFLLVPAIYSNFWSSYVRNVSRGIQFVWVFFIIVGLSSAYYHATLSRLGQILDEVSIFWMWMYIYTLISPIQYRLKFLRKNKLHFRIFNTLLTVFFTALVHFYPAVFYAIYVLFVVTGTFMVMELQASRDSRIIRLGIINIVIGALAITSLVSDWLLCEVWEALNMTVLHGVWHILIFLACYLAVSLFSLFYACQEAPESRPVFRYWPQQFYGLPYVYCKSAFHNKTP